MREVDPQSQAFFDHLYRSVPDPWDFESSEYEQNRYRATLAALSRPSYRRIYEPGCSVGVLTRALAGRSADVQACDLSRTAVRRARERCRDCPNVHIEHRDVSSSRPDGKFDLIVFSEIGYYFSADRLGLLARDLSSLLDVDGEFVAVNWLGKSADHLLEGDEVYEVLDASLACVPITGTRHEGFRIDAWRRAS